MPWTVSLSDGRTVTAFPVALAILAAPVYLVFGAAGLPVLGLLSLMGICILLLRWRPPFAILVLSMVGSFLWIQAFDYSEFLIAAFLGYASLSLLLVTLPGTPEERFSLSLDSTSNALQNRHWRAFMAGLLAGATVWLRHEGLVFGGALLSSILLTPFLVSSKRNNTNNQIKQGIAPVFVPFAAGFALPVLFWAVWNILDYGHWLGPRFLVNREGVFPPLLEMLQRYQNLLLAGDLKVGLFAFLPFLPFLLIRTTFRWIRGKRPGPLEAFLFFAISIYAFSVPALVPNDGMGGLGPRYLIFAVMPAFMLASLWYPSATSLWKSVFHVWVAISALLPITLLTLVHKGTIYQHAMHDRYAQDSAEIRVFASEPLYNSFGVSTLTCDCYLARGDADLEDLLGRLRKHRPGKRISLVHLHGQVGQNVASANRLERMDKELLEKIEKTIVASRWSSARIQNSPFLQAMHKAEFKDVEIWTGRVAGP